MKYDTIYQDIIDGRFNRTILIYLMVDLIKLI
jgi:hypothetical protein